MKIIYVQMAIRAICHWNMNQKFANDAAQVAASETDWDILA